MPKDIHPPKAYNNEAFLNSSAARKIRVLCEMTEPEERFANKNIKDTIVYFGSARSVSEIEAKAALEGLKASIKNPADPSPAEREALRKAKAQLKLAPYYEAAVELSARMTRWSISLRDPQHRFMSCTGGGPGMMEAANRGASEAKGASIGLGISLPFEQGMNPYVTPDLAFEFHYFFVRKYCFAYWAKAIVVFPGGFGTMDEFFELMTLIQTGKISKKIPIILYGTQFWNDILNFDAFVEWGVISPSDLELFKIVDTVDEAETFLIAELSGLYLKK